MAKAMINNEKYYEIIGKALQLIGIFLISYSTLMVVVGVFMRYAMNISFQWLEESCRYAMVFMVLLNIGPLLLKNGHIKLDIVYNLLSNKIQKYLLIVIYIITLIYSSYLLKEAILWVASLYKFNILSLSGLFSLWIPGSAVLIGFFLTFVYTIISIINIITGKAEITAKHISADGIITGGDK